MKKRLLGLMMLGAIVVYGTGCLLPANLLLQLAGDVLGGSEDEGGDDIGDDIGDDMDTNGASDTPEE